MQIPRVDRNNIGILLIDVQPFFLDLADPGGEALEPLLMRLEHLLMLAGWIDLPLVATFEKPVAHNGELPDRLEGVFPEGGRRFVKNHFGSMSEPEIREAVTGLGVGQFVVTGAETDVCVLQTTLGLLESGYQVFLLEDCLFTTESEPGPALRRMYQAGAVPATLKSFAYELLGCVEEIPWYPEGWAMRDHHGAKPFPEGFVAPEDWPPWKPAW